MYFYFVIGTVLCYVFYTYFIKNKYTYWYRKGIKGPEPIPIFGNFKNVMLTQESIDEFLRKNYEKYSDEKFVGLYRGFQPALLVRDPEMIKQVLIKDFGVFQDRGLKPTENKIDDNLFFTEGETWKILRQKLTPLFTSGKLKNMTPLIERCVDDYIKYINKLIENNTDHEIRSLQSKLTLEVIGSCAFGLDLDTFSDKENQFAVVAKELITPTRKARFWMALNMIIPGIRKKLPHLSNTSAHFQRFFVNLVKSIIGERGGKPSLRKDFMDLMIELREQGKVSRRKENGIVEIDINNEMIAAQALAFYFAGFETSAAATSFLLYELALHPNIQERLYQEIREVYEKCNGKLNYEAVFEMKYLEMVFDEILRLRTVAGNLTRKTLADYTFPGTNFIVEKGTPIFISASGLHHDPKYFPNPHEFNPENFSSDNKNNIPPCVYMPFGDGPRNCIGMRFAKVQSMMGLAAFVKNFKVEPSEKTVKTLKYTPKTLTLTSKDGIWLKISKRKLYT